MAINSQYKAKAIQVLPPALYDHNPVTSRQCASLELFKMKLILAHALLDLSGK